MSIGCGLKGNCGGVSAKVVGFRLAVGIEPRRVVVGVVG
jgi:hypothetical protein